MNHLQRDLESLEELGTRVTQFVTQFWTSLSQRPVSAGDRTTNSDTLPLNESGFVAAMEEFEREIAPALSGSAGPRYWGFVTGGTTPAAMMGDWLASGVDQNLSSAGDSIASAVEVQVMGWLRELFDLPAEFFGVLTTGATAANLLGVFCGRQHVGTQLGFNAAQQGLRQPVTVLSGSPHASLIKSLGMAGLGHESWHGVATLSGREAVDPSALDAALAQAGSSAFVVANAGTVTSTDFDDLTAIAEICRTHNSWLHVDGAFGLFARVADKKDVRLKGLEYADSITCDGHKWLNVPYDCGFFFTRKPEVLSAACHVGAPYLETQSQTPDFLSYGIENSRRFRALPLWFTLKAYGRSGVKTIVDNCLARARQLADWLDTHPNYELLTPCHLNVVLFAHKHNPRNQELLTNLNSSGWVVLSPGTWQGRPGIRAAFSNWLTSPRDVEMVCSVLHQHS